MYYYLILALQAYCAYHAFKNKNDYYWYFAIVFLPLIGSLIYLFVNVVRKDDVDKVQEGLVSVFNPTKKIRNLEQKLRFAETFENKVALADAYLEEEHYEKAITYYEASLVDVFQHDFYAISKLEEAYYFSSNFNEAVARAEKIKDQPKFKKSRAAFLYALALEKTGKEKEAETYLKRFDAPYSRYQERLELAKFYIRNESSEKAKEVLREIVVESESLSKPAF